MNKNIVSAILLIHLVECNYEAMSFSKQLYIPGGYYSLNNISYNMNALGRLFNVDVDMSLTQVLITVRRLRHQIRPTRYLISSYST